MVEFMIYLLKMCLTKPTAAYTLHRLFAAFRIWAKWLTLTQGIVKLQAGSFVA